MSNLVGKTLNNRYQIAQLIGRGGMATIYKATDLLRSTTCAIKVLDDELAVDRVFIRRFTREAQALANLQHPNIVRFYNLEQDHGIVFMVLDFIEGRSLKRLIHESGQPMKNEAILSIFRQVCSALQYAHLSGYLHCDLKPENILLDESRKAYLSDFGIARLMDTGTTTLVGAGTPAYMAPELIQGGDPSARSEIYSLGIILYEMVTGGERPFTGEHARTSGSTSSKLLWEQVHQDPPTPRIHNADLSPAMETVILRCLEKNPKSRFAEVKQLLSAVEDALGAGLVRESVVAKQEPVTRIKDSPKPQSTKKPAGFMIFVATAFFAAITLFLTFQNNQVEVVATTTPTVKRTQMLIANADQALLAYDQGVGMTFSKNTIMSGSHPILINTGWYAKDQQTLSRNLKEMNWNFQINGKLVSPGQVAEKSVTVLGKYPCLEKFILVNSWPEGTHHIVSGFSLTRDINDGFFDFKAGDQYQYFSVSVLPESRNRNLATWNRVFSDYFNDDSNGWLVSNTIEKMPWLNEVKDGKLFFKINKSDDLIIDKANSNLNIIGDFSLKIEGRGLSGIPESACWGIEFSNSYDIDICENQYYFIGYSGEDSYKTIQDWTSHSAIKFNSKNSLQVVHVGKMMEFYINEKLVNSFPVNEDDLWNFKIVGFSDTAAIATYEFDNVEVYMP